MKVENRCSSGYVKTQWLLVNTKFFLWTNYSESVAGHAQ